MILLQVRSLHSAGVRHKYAIIFRIQFRIISACQDKNWWRCCILINQLPICDFGHDVTSCSQPIDMDLHLINDVKSSVNKLDAVDKAYVDRIKYKTATGNIPNTVMTDHILFTFPAAKAFASGKIIICEMWVERLADEWIATSSPMSRFK